MKTLKSHLPKLLIAALYWALAFFLWSHFGLKVVNDSARYLEYASNLSSEGFYFDPHNFWYSAYVFFIYLASLVNESLHFLVFCQYVLSFLGILALYDTAKILFDHKLSGLISCLFMLLFIEPIMWNSYILPESFYLSMLCLFFYLLVRVYKNRKDKLTLLSLVLLIPFTLLAKPTAIALLIGFTLTFVYILLKNIKRLFIKIFTLAGIIFTLIILANKMLTTYIIIDNYLLGEIIYGMSYYPGFPYQQLMTIEPNNALYIPENSLKPLHKIALFIIHNPIYWCKLFFGKIFYLISHVRPFWSIWHNLYVGLFLILTYSFFWKGFTSSFSSRKEMVFICSYLGSHILIIGLTSVDYDGRFIIPLLPIIFLLAGNALARLLSKTLIKKH